MKRIIFAMVVAAVSAAILVPLAVAGGGGNSANAQACQKGGWQNLVRQDNTGFNNQDECVSYGAHGGTLTQKPTGPIAVPAPMFGLDTNTCSVTVPYTPGINTVLYGVNGQQETPITQNVTVTGSLDGTDTASQFWAPQFWIGYTAKPGYVITPGASPSPTHFDFYSGDYVRDC